MQLNLTDSWDLQNPGFIHRIYDDFAAEEFIKQEYPSIVMEAFSKFPIIVQRTDFLRYLLLYRYGGYYADFDTECLRPVELWRSGFENEVVTFISGLEVTKNY